ncbi:hypothetical protein COE80_07330 [Bacillus pseudomycoides]|uniref:hypothetical protein n=1 Tax=Bacillus pseudomycoides TaxID=64104 RepID=UPI000BFCCA70|nr:hypothetical protein [Bacillus pseudomycoides]PHB30440.1 hypothetical protein COE80_07330 [Bacillus pseudomycoides]
MSVLLDAIATLDSHMDSPSYMVSSQKDRFCFIVPSYEAESLLLRLNRKYDSFDEATFRSDLILIDRVYMNGYIKKGFTPLQSLKERDKFIWMCRKNVFNETAESEKARFSNDTNENDNDILKGHMSIRLARQLIK